MSFQDFTLLPADDPQSTAQADLDAALAGALAPPDTPAAIDDDPPLPFGRTWRFDWEGRRFVRDGQSPAQAHGLDALAEWCMAAVHIARFSSATFSDEFGMEEPESVIGQFAVGELLADWERHLIEALMVHDRVTSVENVQLRWDPAGGVLYLDRLEVVTDEDLRVAVSDVALTVGGG